MKKLLRLLLVREDEKVTVLYFLSFFFIVGCGLAMGKASAEALFFKRYGIEYLPVMYIALGIVLSLVSIIYASFADRMSAEKFYLRIFLAFSILLILCWAGMNLFETQAVYPLYFLVYEAISEILLIHSALYLSQNLDSFKAKRLSPVIFSGSQLGLIFGGAMVALLAPLVGTNNIILLWCSLLVLATLMIMIRHKVKGPSAYYYNQNARLSLNQTFNSIKQGIHFSRNSTLLRSVSIAFFFLVIAFYTLHFITNQIYNNHFTEEAELTAFFGILTAATGFISILIQVLLTNRAIKQFGIQKLNIAFPVSITISFFALIIALKLPAALLGSFVKDSLNPALNTPVRNLILTVLPKNLQGRIRAVSIGIILPLALITCSLILLLAQHFENSYYFLVPGLASGLLLIIFSLRVNKSYVKTLIHHLKDQVYISERSTPADNFSELQYEFKKNVLQSDDRLIISYAKLLFEINPDKACHIIISQLYSTRPKTTDKLIKIIAKHSTVLLDQLLKDYEKFTSFDEHNKSTLLGFIYESGSNAADQYIENALNSHNPRLSACGILGTLSVKNHPLRQKAISIWPELLQGDQHHKIASLTLSRFINTIDDNNYSRLVCHYNDALTELLNSSNHDHQVCALKTLSTWQHDLNNELKSIIPKLLNEPHPKVRASAINCLHLLESTKRLPLLLLALDDGHATARQQAINSLVSENDDTDLIATQWLVENNNYTTPRAQHSLLVHCLKSGLQTATLKNIVASKTELARLYYDAKQILVRFKNQSPYHYLTYTTVTERIDQTIQLLLGALQHIEQQELVEVANAAIISRDPLLIASACDALKNLNNKTLSDLLIDLLQDDFELKTNYILSFNNLAYTLEWCSKQDDWLHDCASEALRHD